MSDSNRAEIPEIILTSEEVTRRNVQSMLEHGNETRRLVRNAEAKIAKLEAKVLAQSDLLAQLQTQVSTLQQRFYAAGTTSYADSK